MAVRIRLNDGTEIVVQATIDELNKALRAATSTGEVLKIEQPNGETIAVTPQAVETMREDPEAGERLREHFAAAAGA